MQHREGTVWTSHRQPRWDWWAGLWEVEAFLVFPHLSNLSFIYFPIPVYIEAYVLHSSLVVITSGPSHHCCQQRRPSPWQRSRYSSISVRELCVPLNLKTKDWHGTHKPTVPVRSLYSLQQVWMFVSPFVYTLWSKNWMFYCYYYYLQ